MHAHEHGHAASWRMSTVATLHCLTGCAIGEVTGMIVGTAAGLSNPATVALSVVLAFAFGYALTMLPLLRSGIVLGLALPLAFASDSISIAVMEVTDNAIILAVPDAMDATLSDGLFWGTLALALAVAFVVALPVNRWLIGRGQGHAVVHGLHEAPTLPRRQVRNLVLLGAGAVLVTVAATTVAVVIVGA